MDSDAARLELRPLLWHDQYPTLAAWIDALHAEYTAIVDPGIVLQGRRIVNARGTAADGRDETFWHLITVDQRGARVLSLYRAAMLGRVRQVLEWARDADPRAVAWREDATGGASHVVVAPADGTLRVVLRQRRSRSGSKGRQLALVTVYPTVKENDRQRTLGIMAAAAADGRLVAL